MMMKHLMMMTVLFFPVTITLQNAIPSLPMLDIYKISILDDGTVFHWRPLENSESREDPAIIGYKLFTWEMRKLKTYRINGTKGIIEYQGIDRERIQDLPNYVPVVYKIVPKGSINAKIECLPRGMYYLTRVKAYSAFGDGPWSEALAWGDVPALYRNGHLVTNASL